MGKKNEEKIFQEFAEEFSNQKIEQYLQTLQYESLRIDREVISQLNTFKKNTKSLILAITLNKNSRLMQNKLIKQLADMYINERVFVASCNKTNILTNFGTYKTIGEPYFHDRAFEKNGVYSLCGGMPYTDSMCFDKTWKNSDSQIEKETYEVRYKMYSKLKGYNRYLDRVKDFIGKYINNLDEKLNKQLNKIKKEDEKKFESYEKNILKMSNRIL